MLPPFFVPEARDHGPGEVQPLLKVWLPIFTDDACQLDACLKFDHAVLAPWS